MYSEIVDEMVWILQIPWAQPQFIANPYCYYIIQTIVFQQDWNVDMRYYYIDL